MEKLVAAIKKKAILGVHYDPSVPSDFGKRNDCPEDSMAVFVAYP